MINTVIVHGVFGRLLIVYTHVTFVFILFPGLFAYHCKHFLLFYAAISDGILERAVIFREHFDGWLVGRTAAFICLNVII